MVCEPVKHLGQHPFEKSLVALRSQRGVLLHLLDISLACFEREHDDLLHFIFQYFDDCV